MALGERFVVLCPDDQEEQDDSDIDGEDDEGSLEAIEDDWEAEGAVREFVVLVHLYSIGSSFP